MKHGVSSLREADDVTKFGGKAANLAILLQADLPVPGGLAVALEAFSEDGKLKPEAKQAIESALKANKLYAVRSSALAEDAEDASWAGQFETFLNTKPDGVMAKVEECHNSTKARAKAYATDKNNESFEVAVVVQEMVEAKHAGVTFTKDPSDGSNKILIEYVSGLGESLVHGDTDPDGLVWSRTKKAVIEKTKAEPPFKLPELIKLAEKIEKVFNDVPQDIEWAMDSKQIWIVQSRPITTLQERGEGKHYLGDPGKLFYWGPSRAKPLYMSDFMAAAQQMFDLFYADPAVPNPPKTIVLFHEGKMVWLNKTKAFSTFVSALFKAYEKADRLEQDRQVWQQAVETVDVYVQNNDKLDPKKLAKLLLDCWLSTIFAEFSLYGTETVLTDRLKRFDERSRAEIWGAMTLGDEPVFMQRVDLELAKTKNVAAMAKKYSWVDDGYGGVKTNAKEYFEKRLTIVAGNTKLSTGSTNKRQALVNKFKLSAEEVSAFDLARGLMEFMDERKAWMMRTRQYMAKAAKAIAKEKDMPVAELENCNLEDLSAKEPVVYSGWSYKDGQDISLTAKDVAIAWDWYVEFRASESVLQGVVVSNGGRHFINGEVTVVSSPTQAVADDRIIVVPSTSPSYVPLMRKARALVTDHGGMMSHAAIVAREFGLPCIVGTKHATKTLKDGDRVVLDLVKGNISK